MNKNRENIRRIMTSVNLINQVYELTAKKFGIKDEMLSLLYALDDGKLYTQKDICKLWNIPKTTINSVIQSFKEKQIITLEDNPLNRKEKYIKITEYGKMYSNEILKPIYEIEEQVYLESEFHDDCVLKFSEFADLLEFETKNYFNSLEKIANKKELKIVSGCETVKYLKDIKKLYYDAFPINERIDFKYFIEKNEKLELLVFTHENSFVGFALAATYQNIVYLLYFAMNSKSRGRGYGSQALELIKRLKKGKTILLDIEVTKINSENSLQRIKRKKFYLRSGFLETTVTYWQRNVEFEILCFGIMVNEKEINEFWQYIPNELVEQYRK